MGNLSKAFVPTNVIANPMRDQFLPVIFCSLLFAFFVKERDEEGKDTKIRQMITEVDEVVQLVISGILSVTPYAIASLVFAAAFRLNTLPAAGNLLMFLAVAGLALLFHLLVFYPLILGLFARRVPCSYFGKLGPAFSTALASASSTETLDSATKLSESNGIAADLAKKVLPVCASVNMAGTSLYVVLAVYFLGAMQGLAFGTKEFLELGLLATLGSAGTVPIPGSGLLLVAAGMAAMGLQMKTEDFALIAAVDFLLDRLRTVVNIAGDAVVVGIVQGNVKRV